MPVLERLAEGFVHIARQATATSTATVLATISAATASATTPAANADASASATLGGAVETSADVPTMTSSAASATNTVSSGSGNSNGGGSSSPLLFFVALGFGVVFTNLWIIVGVKYCFRYNARARALRQAQEDGEPITLEPVPRPHRRRREKKLMSIDEVNEKFPMTKYKSWVANREREGLSTRGGIDAPTRANSVRSVEGIAVQHKERDSTDESEESKQVVASAIAAVVTTSTPDLAISSAPSNTPAGVATTSFKEETGAAATSAPAATAAAAPTDSTHDDDHHHSGDEDDDHDEHMIDAALPPECIGTEGDTCAICIDTLEDDDDVRGLTCGHAFHAVCLDPWLTSRRACCPLCKADYYTPKPRPQLAEGAELQVPGPVVIAIASHSDTYQQQQYGNASGAGQTGRSWNPFRSMQRTAGPGPVTLVPSATMDGNASQRRGLFGRRWAATSQSQSESAASGDNSSRSTWMSSIWPLMPGFRSGRQQAQGSQGSQGSSSEVTLSQLEAGSRR